MSGDHNMHASANDLQIGGQHYRMKLKEIQESK